MFWKSQQQPNALLHLKRHNMQYLDQFEREAFMEYAVDLGPTGQLSCTDLRPSTLNALLKVLTKLGDHPARESTGSFHSRQSRQKHSWIVLGADTAQDGARLVYTPQTSHLLIYCSEPEWSDRHLYKEQVMDRLLQRSHLVFKESSNAVVRTLRAWRDWSLWELEIF